MNKKWAWLGAAVIVLIILAGFFVVTSNQPNPSNPVKIGVLYPLSGNLAFGEAMKNGAILAAENINAKGGINGRPIELIIEDSKADGKEAVTAFTKIHSTGDVRYYLTTVSAVGMVLKPLAKDRNVLLFNDIAHVQATSGAPAILRHSQSIEQEVSLIETFVKNKGFERIGVLALNDEFGLAYINGLQSRLDGKTFLIEKMDASQTDFKTNVQKIMNSEVIVLAGAGKNFGLALKQLKELGYAGEVVTALGFTLVPGSFEAAGDAKKGVYYLSFDESAVKEEFKTQYKNRFGKDATFLAMVPYTDIELMAKGISQVGDDPQKVATYIKSLSQFEGTFENVKITPEGNIWPPVVINQFE